MLKYKLSNKAMSVQTVFIYGLIKIICLLNTNKNKSKMLKKYGPSVQKDRFIKDLYKLYTINILTQNVFILNVVVNVVFHDRTT